jgi:hypothetical protein
MKPTGAENPEDYIAQIDEPRRGEIQQLHDLIRAIAPDLEPHIEAGMLGYGHYHYRYPSGREGDWFPVGLASQKRYISVYVCGVRDGRYVAESNAPRMPKANVGKSCIRFKRLADMDLDILVDVIREGVETMRPEIIEEKPASA